MSLTADDILHDGTESLLNKVGEIARRVSRSMGIPQDMLGATEEDES